MDAYNFAVETAKFENEWISHPNKKRKQEIAFVADVGQYWNDEHPEHNIPINACVVRELVNISCLLQRILKKVPSK